MSARSGASSRKVLREQRIKAGGYPEVMIRNVDRETANLIISQLGNIEIQDFSFKNINKK